MFKIGPLVQLPVGVTNGQLKISNARVKFQVKHDPKFECDPEHEELKLNCGFLHITKPDEGEELPQGNADLEVTTDVNGLAQCYYQMAPNEDILSQQVEALLLDAAGQPTHLPVLFNANISRAIRVALYDVPDCGNEDDPTIRFLLRNLFQGRGVLTVKDVFDILL